MSSAELRFSAVVPLFNRRDLIGETLASLQGQSRQFKEIIVVDDGSNDAGADFVRRNHPNVIVIMTPNQGVQAARNKGVEQAASEWIVFCDSDDLLEPTYLQSVENILLQNYSIDALFVNFRTFGQYSLSEQDKFSQAPSGFWPLGSESQFVGIRECPEINRLIDFQPFFPTGLVVKRDVFYSLGQYDMRLNGWKSEDLEFTFRLLEGACVKALDAVLAQVRKHEGNDSRVFHRMLVGDADIFELFAREHLEVDDQVEFLHAAIARRWAALDHSIGQRDWASASCYAKKVTLPAPSFRLLSKYFVARALAPLFN